MVTQQWTYALRDWTQEQTSPRVLTREEQMRFLKYTKIYAISFTNLAV